MKNEERRAHIQYLHWDEKTITDFSPRFISDMYQKGYVFTRVGKGVMQQTRSARIDLGAFELSSENRRILKKVPDVSLYSTKVPLSGYSYPLGKLAKDFYDQKFGPGIMSAQKIKEMLTDTKKSNFNLLLKFDCRIDPTAPAAESAALGYSICYQNQYLLHYSYPFYDLKSTPKDMGLGMMIRAIQFAKEKNLKYIYLGSLQRPSDTYKLQFQGIEWYDGVVHRWSRDMAQLKGLLSIDNQCL